MNLLKGQTIPIIGIKAKLHQIVLVGGVET
jgi:hypothetical protein